MFAVNVHQCAYWTPVLSYYNVFGDLLENS